MVVMDDYIVVSKQAQELYGWLLDFIEVLKIRICRFWVVYFGEGYVKRFGIIFLKVGPAGPPRIPEWKFRGGSCHLLSREE